MLLQYVARIRLMTDNNIFLRQRIQWMCKYVHSSNSVPSSNQDRILIMIAEQLLIHVVRENEGHCVTTMVDKKECTVSNQYWLGCGGVVTDWNAIQLVGRPVNECWASNFVDLTIFRLFVLDVIGFADLPLFTYICCICLYYILPQLQNIWKEMIHSLIIHITFQSTYLLID